MMSVMAATAQAATFNFFFADQNDPSTGLTVSGTITLPDGDGTHAATDVTITSAPINTSFSAPISLDLSNDATLNSFTVTSGVITSALFFALRPELLLSLFENADGSADEAILQLGDGQDYNRFVDGTAAAEPFSSVAAVPLPASFPLLLAGFAAVLGLGTWRRRRA